MTEYKDNHIGKEVYKEDLELIIKCLKEYLHSKI